MRASREKTSLRLRIAGAITTATSGRIAGSEVSKLASTIAATASPRRFLKRTTSTPPSSARRGRRTKAATLPPSSETVRVIFAVKPPRTA